MNDDKAALEGFSGIARLFPLPNLVFFPHALQPLHIFEPRYRQMTADALAGDRLIALVLLQPGWEKNYEQKPIIHPVACLGRIFADQLLPDGRYNLLLRGLSRVRIVEELVNEDSYRSARVELIADGCNAPLDLIMHLRRELEQKILPHFSDGPITKQLTDLFHSELTLGALCDVLSFVLPVPVERKQMILEETQEDLRALLLMDGFGPVPSGGASTVAGLARKFPPDFSAN